MCSSDLARGAERVEDERVARGGRHGRMLGAGRANCQSGSRSPIIGLVRTTDMDTINERDARLPAMTDAALLARAMAPDLRIGRGILAPHVAALPGTYLLLSQAGPLAAADPAIAARAIAVAEVASLAEEDLAALERSLPPADRVVGIGGGMTIDATKYVAWRRGIPFVLAPSIVSVDAPVTNTVAVRRAGTVVYEGFVVAESIVADLALIARAPARLNRAGVGDLLSIHTGRFDWALGARAGTDRKSTRLNSSH